MAEAPTCPQERQVSSGSYAHYLRARVAEDSGDHRRALDELRLALATDEGNPFLTTELAKQYARLSELDRAEQRRLVAEALQSLDDATRPVVVLRYYEGLCSKEIGGLLDLTPAAVDMRLSRARQQLRQYLRRTGSFTREER